MFLWQETVSHTLLATVIHVLEEMVIALSSVLAILSFIGTVNFINNSANDGGGGGVIYIQSGNTELIASTGPVISSTTQQVMVMYTAKTLGLLQPQF